jgi:transcriptional regulator with XRE-family HTH domain
MTSAANRVIALAFGAALRSARNEAELSQEALADRAGVDRTTPSLYERGLRQPTIATLIALSRGLGCEPASLLRMTLARLQEAARPET